MADHPEIIVVGDSIIWLTDEFDEVVFAVFAEADRIIDDDEDIE